jgi:hypothetical protein
VPGHGDNSSRIGVHIPEFFAAMTLTKWPVESTLNPMAGEASPLHRSGKRWLTMMEEWFVLMVT